MDAPIFMAIFLASELITISLWYIVTKYKKECTKPRYYTATEVVKSNEVIQLSLSVN